jgi:hypothetical protein
LFLFQTVNHAGISAAAKEILSEIRGVLYSTETIWNRMVKHISKDDTSKNATSKDDTSKNAISKGDTSKNDISKGDTSKTTSQEATLRKMPLRKLKTHSKQR